MQLPEILIAPSYQRGEMLSEVAIPKYLHPKTITHMQKLNEKKLLVVYERSESVTRNGSDNLVIIIVIVVVLIITIVLYFVAVVYVTAIIFSSFFCCCMLLLLSSMFVFPRSSLSLSHCYWSCFSVILTAVIIRLSLLL